MGRPLNIETGVNRFESERERREKLENLLSMFAQEINAEASKHGVKNLLDPKGRISMENYSKEAGGIFQTGSIQQDQKELKDREILNSRANIPAVQEFYKAKYNITTQEGIVKQREKLKKEKVGYQGEIALTILLQKVLGKNFWVVRSSEYDDNKYGVDKIIVNKETGEAVCGLDDLIEEEAIATTQGTTNKQNEKRARVMGKVLRGDGGHVKYGLKVNYGQLQRAKMEHLPIFYLAITKDQLQELMAYMQPNSHEVSQKEKETFALLVASLKEQYTEYTQIATHQILKNKYAQFGKMLNEFEQIALEN